MKKLKQFVALMLILTTALTALPLSAEAKDTSDNWKKLYNKVLKDSGNTRYIGNYKKSILVKKILLTKKPLTITRGQSVDIGSITGKFSKARLKQNKASVSLSPLLVYPNGSQSPLTVKGKKIKANAPVKTAVKVTYTYHKKKGRKQAFTKKKYKTVYLLAIIACPDESPSYECEGAVAGSDKAYTQSNYASMMEHFYDEESETDASESDNSNKASGEDNKDTSESDNSNEASCKDSKDKNDEHCINVKGIDIYDTPHSRIVLDKEGRIDFGSAGNHYDKDIEAEWLKKYKKYWDMPTISDLESYKQTAGEGTELQRYLRVARRFANDMFYSPLRPEDGGVMNDILANPDIKNHNPKWMGLCEDFSLYAYILFNYVGINTRRVGNPGHVWNMVQIDGDWYICDFTWAAGSNDYRCSSGQRPFIFFGNEEIGDGSSNGKLSFGETRQFAYYTYTLPSETEVETALGTKWDYGYQGMLVCGQYSQGIDILDGTCNNTAEETVDQNGNLKNVIEPWDFRGPLPTPAYNFHGEVKDFMTSYYELSGYDGIKQKELLHKDQEDRRNLSIEDYDKQHDARKYIWVKRAKENGTATANELEWLGNYEKQLENSRRNEKANDTGVAHEQEKAETEQPTNKDPDISTSATVQESSNNSSKASEENAEKDYFREGDANVEAHSSDIAGLQSQGYTPDYISRVKMGLYAHKTWDEAIAYAEEYVKTGKIYKYITDIQSLQEQESPDVSREENATGAT